MKNVFETMGKYDGDDTQGLHFPVDSHTLVEPTPMRRHCSLTLHIVLCVLAILLVLASAATIFFVEFLKAGPILDRNKLALQESIRIVDRTNGTLYQFSNAEQRLSLPGNSIPLNVRNAIVAIEDERFFVRKTCIDVRALLRAVKVNIFENGQQGASTLTQQLVRMLYLTRERTITRKVYEILLSCRLEHLLTKDEILTLYLNGVSFGNGINGIEAAAKAYLGKSAEQLSVAEAATLVSIPQRPTYFSPYGPNLKSSIDAETLRSVRKGSVSGATLQSLTVTGLLPKIIQAKGGAVRIPGRADAVLKAMLRTGFIDQSGFDEASKELLRLRFKPRRHGIAAPHFTLSIRDEITSLLQSVSAPAAWQAAGLTAETTLDPNLQRIAEKIILESQELLQKSLAKNIALVAIDRRNRQVLAYVGNNDFFIADEEGQIDMAKVPRQPGSSFKPLVYATAFERGFTPETIVRDEPIRIGSDIPKNYEGGFKGKMTIRSALAQSRNIPAIKTFLDIGGEDPVLEAGSRAGVTTPLIYKQEMLKTNPHFTYGWPMAIGSVEVPLLEMVELYATIANHGLYQPLRMLCALKDAERNVILQLPQEPPTVAFASEAADQVDDILRDSKSRPEGYWRTMLTIPGLDTAAKTGTSNVCFRRDIWSRCTEYGVNNVWTLGYSNNLVVGVWVGNADNSILDPLADGLTVAAPIWRKFLESASNVNVFENDSCT